MILMLKKLNSKTIGGIFFFKNTHSIMLNLKKKPLKPIYRARSAFKLIEIDDKHHILKPGHTVVECGAAPGAWTQVCAKRINSCGTCNCKTLL